MRNKHRLLRPIALLLVLSLQLLIPVKVLAAPVRGVSEDLWGDIVIGQPNFNEIATHATTDAGLFLPHGVIIDRTNPSDNKMYVYDGGNNRILGYDVEDCLAAATDPLGCTPDIVIGQPNFTSSTCNGDSAFQNYPDRAAASASTLCTEEESSLSISESGSGASMDIDDSGNLYVADFYNNRVLRYNTPFTTDQVADYLWGQSDYTGVLCNRGGAPGDDTLCFEWGDSNNWTAGVDVDGDGNLWVSDSGNNRVLRYSFNGVDEIYNYADLVLGQSDFSGQNPASDLDRLWDPSAVRVDNLGRVFVADTNNNRIMMYDNPETNGEAGVTFGSGFSYPQGIDFDDTESNKLWIVSRGNNTIELWDIAGETKDEVLGIEGDGNLLGDVSGSIGVDSSGGVFVATGTGEYDNTVLYFEDGEPGTSYTYQLISSSQYGNIRTDSELQSIRGIVVAGDQLIIADEGRILFWDISGGIENLTSGQAADGYVLSSGMNEINPACCYDLKTDDAGHLYTTTNINGDDHQAVQIFNLPLTSGEAPAHVLEYPFTILGGGSLTDNNIFEPFSGIQPSSDGNFLWVSEATSNRVFRLRNPLTSPEVDVVLGQVDSSGTSCNQGGSATNTTLCHPGGLAYDKLGNFFVSDHWLEAYGNWRFLRFDPDTFPTDNLTPIYTQEPDNITTEIASWTPAFDSLNRMVLGYNGYYGDVSGTLAPGGRQFPAVFNDPTDEPLAADDYLLDYFPMANFMTFDFYDNLIVGELNRARVLIYLQPFGDPAPVIAEVTPVTTPTTDTTPSYTFSSTEAGDITYGGSCTSLTGSNTIGNNTITFEALSPGTYSDCTIIVTDISDQDSNTLNVSSFTIEEDTPEPSPSPSPSPSPTPSPDPETPASQGITGTVDIQLISPQGYTRDTKPTLVFKKAQLSAGTVAQYEVSLDPGRNYSFNVGGLPANNSSQSESTWRDDADVKVTYHNEHDSDVTNDEIHVYFKGLDAQSLFDGEHNWRVKVTTSENQWQDYNRGFNVDTAAPDLSLWAVSGQEAAPSGDTYFLSAGHQPAISGLVSDPYRGGTVTNANGSQDTFTKVASAPRQVTLKIDELVAGVLGTPLATYQEYDSSSADVTSPEDVVDQYRRANYFVSATKVLTTGSYRFQIVTSDNAGNSSVQQTFYVRAGLAPVIVIPDPELPSPAEVMGPLTPETGSEIVEATASAGGDPEGPTDLRLVIVDPDGRPVVGAVVTLSNGQTVVTNESGVVEFPDLEGAVYGVSIETPDGTTQQQVEVRSGMRQQSFTIQLTGEPEPTILGELRLLPETQPGVVGTALPYSAAAVGVALPAAGFVLLLSSLGSLGSAADPRLAWKLLQALGLFAKNKPLGMIFETGQFQPVPFALLTVKSTQNSGLGVTETLVSDVHGVYQGISLPPGNYTMNVAHQEYAFPAKPPIFPYMSPKEYYRGEEFRVSSAKERQFFLVPLDPMGAVTKQGLLGLSKQVRLLFSKLNWMTFSLPLAAYSFWSALQFPSLLNWAILGLYGVFFGRGLVGLLKQPVVLGQVVDAQDQPLPHAIIRLSSSDSSSYAAIVTSDDRGKFKIFAPKSKYQINVFKPGFEWQHEGSPMSFEEIDTRYQTKKLEIKMGKAQAVDMTPLSIKT